MNKTTKEILQRTFLGICILFGLAPVTFIAWYRWDSVQNRGFEFGYFGQFNQVRQALKAIPGVAITQEWANHDLSLEEFGFQVITSKGQSVHLTFAESDPIRAYSGQQLKDALTARLQQ